MLGAAARGEEPSIAQQQLQQTLGQNQRAAAGLMASQRGLNPALAARLVSNQQAGMAQDAAAQGAVLRAQEVQANRALLAQQLGQQRGQDLSAYGQAAQGGAGQAALASQNQNYAMGLQANMDVANANRQQEAQRMQMQQKMVDEKARADMLAGIAQAGGKLGMMAAMAKGGTVPGDHPANDIVPAMLSPGEIVLPRSVAKAPDAPERAAEFVVQEKIREGFDPAEMMAELDILNMRLEQIERKRKK